MLRRAEGGASLAAVDESCRRSVRSSVSLPERGVSIPTLSSSGLSTLRAVSDPGLWPTERSSARPRGRTAGVYAAAAAAARIDLIGSARNGEGGTGCLDGFAVVRAALSFAATACSDFSANSASSLSILSLLHVAQRPEPQEPPLPVQEALHQVLPPGRRAPPPRVQLPGEHGLPPPF